MIRNSLCRVEGDDRSADERRADVLADLLLGRCSAADRDTGLRPLVHVTVSAATLLGTDDKPGELAPYGPIAADTARRLAADTSAVLHRLVTDPMDGSLVELSRKTYRPPAALDAYVRARDGNCRFPCCQHSAQHADLDHTVRWPDGPTTAENLAALCRPHHRLEHESAWAVRRDGDLLHWRSPTGREYTTRPLTHDPP